MQCNVPSTPFQGDGGGDFCVKTDVRPDVEMINVVIEIFGNLGVMWEHRVVIGHRIVRVLHTRLRGIDEERVISAGHAVGVLIGPVATDAVARFVAIKRNAIIFENFSGCNTRRASTDDTGAIRDVKHAFRFLLP